MRLVNRLYFLLGKHIDGMASKLITIIVKNVELQVDKR